MADGRFIDIQLALKRMVKELPMGRQEAARLMADALLVGSLTARGRPILDYIWPDTPKGVLVDLATAESQPVYGAAKAIAAGFWEVSEALQNWDGQSAWFDGSARAGPLAFDSVKVRDKDVNALIEKHLRASGGDEHRRERATKPELNDWIAAVATLAYEHQIEGNMTQRDLLDRISARLQSWGLDERPDSTVGPRARVILARFRSHHPVKPLN